MKSKDCCSLLELDGDYYIGFNNDITFSLNNKKSILPCKANNVYKLVDPTLDRIFKSIFGYGKESNKIVGQQRLISFLNSILFSKYGQKIIAIEYLQNDLVKPNQKSNFGTRIADIVLKATFENNRTVFIDIEIQTSFYQQIFRRWVEYASRLFSNVEKETLLLVLQADDTKNRYFSIYPVKKDENPFIEKKIEDTFEIVSINIKNAISSIKQNNQIKFGDIEVTEEAKNWLKIIGLRYWIKPIDDFYMLPAKLSVSPEIQSAINLLSVYTPEMLGDIMQMEYRDQKLFEDGYYTCEEKIKEQYALEFCLELFKEGMITKLSNKLNKMDNIDEQRVRELFKDDPDIEEFIKFLSEKGKLI